MSWIEDLAVFRHNMFIVFIECKFDERGTWQRRDSVQTKHDYEVIMARDNSEYNLVHVIEPDGLRRIFEFGEGATIGMHGNVLSYNSERVRELAVDAKEQAGKGKTRDKLL